MAVDALSSAPHYRAHLLPLWEALPAGAKGNRIDLDGGGPPQFRALRSSPRASGNAVIVASFRDMGHAWQRGYRRIAFIEHGAGQSYLGLMDGSYAGGPGRDPVGLFFEPNEAAAARDRAAYLRARIEVIGDPALDSLSRGNPPAWDYTGPAGGLEQIDPIVCLSFHWTWTKIPEMRSALDHYLPALPDLVKRYRVIGHAHPRALDRLAPIYRRLGIELVPTFREVCERASVYVCDNSSTLFEFASTGRPVVVLNAPWYRRDVEHGLRFWAAAGIGRNVDQPEELGDAIARSLSEPQPSSVAAALRLAYSELTGAAQRGAAILAGWAHPGMSWQDAFG
jgi:hypothetical protein